MAEALSPNPKQRIPFASPTSPFFLASNDDKLERAQARAARAAAIRRKSIVPTASHATFSADAAKSFLDQQQIFELFQNCIKLASENKINQKNTWELNLIDHLNDIIKVEEENDTETNFQKASCTLEAGVKIYSMRVDSVHSEAYKVLGGINRVGQENEQDHVVGDANNDGGQEGGVSKNVQEKKLSPLSTLESSFETLNVKKFDVAFAVDPLYHQTTAQFDEGGAKGLLLNNLGVFGKCRVLFDSMEVPGKCTLSLSQHDRAETIDLSFARECIEQMVFNMPKKDDISPSLGDIVNQFDDDHKRSEVDCSGQKSSEQVFESFDNNFELDGNEYEDYGTCAMDQDDQTSVVDEGTYGGDPILADHHEDKEPYGYNEPGMDDRFEKVEGYLFSSLGFSAKQNAWAGPDHWKYRKAKGPEDPADENGPLPKAKKARNRKSESDIDFTKDLDNDMSHIFAPPKNPKSILLPANKATCNIKLPEDCHYQPEDLVKLFLLPNVMCLGTKGRKDTDDPGQEGDSYGAMPSWDDEDGYSGAFDDGNALSDVDIPSELVSQPRQINKIDVQYDKTSKQVDVQTLKETLWDHMQVLNESSAQEEKISFRQALSSFPSDCRAAPSVSDISPHLCFICLLHLANEHGLLIQGSPNLDDLSVHHLQPRA